ncbi:helix-turn-helix transcriptional regulator [Nocardioides sp. GY 10113]|uniref:winged helix-turn-helix transcriptional regulator n=1 Tax=Nocardioides sp. GY 10113 TaxID=2569761 RepID=UPI0010A88E9B|nr:helix-turn-helix domain-containing protein [Nocardioides sp. GY 10113]TIC87499.1 helix-turn-helix transcriptional regulator [Nocardioides sp. GY 10113]
MGTPSTSTPPTALTWSVDNCSLGRAMAILGERWTVVVLREVFLGVRRFADIQRHAGIPRQVLTARLATLVEHGILHRVPYQDEGARTRHEYRLTEIGMELQPILLAITRWGDAHLADPAGVPTEFVHRDCGAPVHVEIHCAAGHHLADPREVTSRPGPSAKPFGAAAREA